MKQFRCSSENQDGKKGIQPANHLAEDSEALWVEQETGSHIGTPDFKWDMPKQSTYENTDGGI